MLNEFYSRLFTSLQAHDLDRILDGVDETVIDEMRVDLAQAYTSEEMDAAIKEMAPLKAPGLDGMAPLFFQTYWTDIGMDVHQAVLSSLNSGVILQSINYTFISLIPKSNNLEKVSDFRPISLCNVIYKIAKTTLFFGKNTDDQTREAIKVSLRVPAIQHYEKYLGLPSFIDRSYNVRSAYRLLASEEWNTNPTSSTMTEQKCLWKKLWKIWSPNKIHHFMWCTTKDSLLMKQNLRAQHVPTDETCEQCVEQREHFCIAYGCVIRPNMFGQSTQALLLCIRNSTRLLPI
ncbi:hypothetical protein SO802_011949 [Lithocarpus litseifolius]|uniref:Reverse transcriptase zinc-binding domain-containing protein n=1 Tax=Lithocarpus litseifolius TaxID=425828 RepID=A0AAW2D3X5_9ROSI